MEIRDSGYEEKQGSGAGADCEGGIGDGRGDDVWVEVMSGGCA